MIRTQNSVSKQKTKRNVRIRTCFVNQSAQLKFNEVIEQKKNDEQLKFRERKKTKKESSGMEIAPVRMEEEIATLQLNGEGRRQGVRRRV
ncbi:hypothetical protein SDJN03_09452, partial [Cucurbita argyrosperma subsp. sororia]